MNQLAFQTLLREQLNLRKSKNPAYSVRAFAKHLDLGIGTLSEVLTGKRMLSEKTARKALDKLSTGPTERSKIFEAKKSEPSFAQTQLDADCYFILSDWYYLAILNLIRTRDFKPTAKYVSERLGIPLKTASQALERLTRTKLVRIENKKMVRTNAAIKTTDGTPNHALRKSHYDTLERARIALDEHPFGTFDATWLTFAFSPIDMKAAQKKIREFQDEFAEQFSTHRSATEVYRLAVQLFSLTKPLIPTP